MKDICTQYIKQMYIVWSMVVLRLLYCVLSMKYIGIKYKSTKYAGVFVIVSTYADKGGVGKTTLLVLMASALAAMQKRVLIIENDPQGSLTNDVYRIGAESGLSAIYHSGVDIPLAIKKMIVPTAHPFVHCITPGVDLADYVRRDDTEVHVAIEKFMYHIQSLGYEYILIDNPLTQSQGGTPLIFTSYAQKVLLPSRPQLLDYEGLKRCYAVLSENPGFAQQQIFVIPSLYESQRKEHKEFFVFNKEAKEATATTPAIEIGYAGIMIREFHGVNGNTFLTNSVGNRAEIADAMYDPWNWFISSASKSGVGEILTVFHIVFPEIPSEAFVDYTKVTLTAIKEKSKKNFIENVVFRKKPRNEESK